MNDQTRDPAKPTEQAAEWRAPVVNTVDEQPLLTRPAPRARRWRWIAIAVLVIAAIVAAWFWFGRGAADPTKAGGGKGDPNARPVPVVAAPARKGTIDVYIDALGTVTPRNMVVVHSRVDGQLMTVAFREGQDVKAGDLLAQIDPRPFEVMLTQANGQMARDQALLKNAQLDLERYRTLLTQDSVSKQQVDTQEALVRQYQRPGGPAASRPRQHRARIGLERSGDDRADQADDGDLSGSGRQRSSHRQAHAGW
jgi:multidrug efflux system membrane fusion protein